MNTTRWIRLHQDLPPHTSSSLLTRHTGIRQDHPHRYKAVHRLSIHPHDCHYGTIKCRGNSLTELFISFPIYKPVQFSKCGISRIHVYHPRDKSSHFNIVGMAPPEIQKPTFYYSKSYVECQHKPIVFPFTSNRLIKQKRPTEQINNQQLS